MNCDARHTTDSKKCNGGTKVLSYQISNGQTYTVEMNGKPVNFCDFHTKEFFRITEILEDGRILLKTKDKSCRTTTGKS